jgi:hypothetical protein
MVQVAEKQTYRGRKCSVFRAGYLQYLQLISKKNKRIVTLISLRRKRL